MEYKINEAIRAKTLLVIDEKGNSLGQLSRYEALDKAKAANLDLVLISPNASIPVAKILDYGKMVYEQNKKDKKSKKNQVQIKIKEIYVKPNIAIHDFECRVNNAKKWLSEGNKVKFVVQTYGRLTLHQDLVTNIYQRFITSIAEFGKSESELKKINFKNHEVIIAPIKIASKSSEIKQETVNEEKSKAVKN